MLLHWLRERRRRLILEEPFPEEWVEFIEANVVHWRFLDADEREHLEQLVQVFVAEKTWEPCGGLKVTFGLRPELYIFSKYLRPLIDNGYIYIAQPPLYRIDYGSKTDWASDDKDRDRILNKLPPRARARISRFKGLGEMMPKTLFQTTMDPKHRSLLRISIPDGARLETEQVVTDLMGKDASSRFREITSYMDLVDEVDA